MQRFFGEKRDSYGRVEVGASVSVYETGTSNLATIYSASDSLTTPTSAIPNPMTTDSNGRYGFAANNGTYDIVVKGSGSSEYHNKVNLFDSSTSSTSGAGGSSTQVQYNSGGVLTGSSALTTDGTNLTVGGYSSVEATRFNTSTPDTSNVVGNTYWDSTNGTLATVLDATAGVVLQHGQELHVSCVNKTGVLIPNGSAVYVNDAQGNRPTCALAKADSLTTCQVIGVTTQAIAINGTGLVTIAGDVHDYNTSVFSGDGKTLYLSATTAGLITETAPTSPNYLVAIGTNLNTTTNGSIFVNPSRPIALDTTLAADSGLVAPSQKASKAYTDTLQANLASTASAALGDGMIAHSDTLSYSIGTVGRSINYPKNFNIDMISQPGSAITAVVSGIGVLTGTYDYTTTFITATGETSRGGASIGCVAVANKIQLSNIPTSADSRVIGRKIYRSYSGAPDSNIRKLVTTINDNVTTTYLDNVADGSLGAYSPFINTTGGNTYVNSLRSGYAGDQYSVCAAFGGNTLLADSQYANSAFGPSALTVNTTGVRNCAFGLFSLYLNVSGSANCSFGVHAMNNNVSGGNNCAFGYSALQKATASANCAFGVEALNSLVSGSSNCAFGYRALYSDTADNNSAFGYNASGANTTGIYVDSFGFNANGANVNGNFNCAFGRNTLQSNVSGSGNTAIGALAALKTTSSSSTVIGNQAALNTTGGYNTVIGDSAMKSSTSGDGNVIIGWNAGYWETGNNTLMIDMGARSSEADARAKALIYGKFDSAVVNQYVLVNGAIKTATFTVSGLPSGSAGMRSFVTDASAPAFGAAVVGGGAVGVPVYHDGTSWKVG